MLYVSKENLHKLVKHDSYLAVGDEELNNVPRLCDGDVFGCCEDAFIANLSRIKFLEGEV